MKLVNMKRTGGGEKVFAEAGPSSDSPAYPYGLEVRLDKESLEKLKLADKLPKAGAEMDLRAVVCVTHVMESETKDGGVDCSLTLQITDLGLSAPKASAADTLYNGGKAAT